MEIGLENLYVDIGAYIGLTEVLLYFLLQRDSSAPETLWTFKNFASSFILSFQIFLQIW